MERTERVQRRGRRCGRVAGAIIVERGGGEEEAVGGGGEEEVGGGRGRAR